MPAQRRSLATGEALTGSPLLRSSPRARESMPDFLAQFVEPRADVQLLAVDNSDWDHDP